MREIVHCYFTEGFFKWGKLFTESLKVSDGEKYELILSTRNLEQDKIDELHSLYNNLTVLNKNLNYDEMAKKANITRETLIRYKNQTESKKITSESKIWKLMISADDRQKEVQKIVHSLEDGDILMHFDVDCLVRNSLEPFFDIARKNDYTGIMNVYQQRLRGEADNPRMGVIGCYQCYNVNEKSKKFLDQWVAEIEAIPLLKRPQRFGQITAYQAFHKLENELSWGDIPKNKIAINTGGGKNKILWSCCVGNKDDNYRIFNQELNKMIKKKKNENK